MFYKFQVLAAKWHRVALCTMLALALAACNSGSSDGTAGQSAIMKASSQPFVVTTIPPTSVRVGSRYQYKPMVSTSEAMKLSSDEDGRVLSYAILNKPDWASFEESSGELSGTPEQSDVGTTGEIQIEVSDGTAHATVGPFRIVVLAQPRDPEPHHRPDHPTISGVPAAAVTTGQSYSFAPTVAERGDGDLNFSIVNRPAWAKFNTATGALTGTPTSASEGTFANILISVHDGA